MSVREPTRRPATGPVLAVDRVACSGHGVCAQLLAGVRLDEWGYPVIDGRPGAIDPAEAAPAIALCPARALYLR
ncbi:MAG: ferredoxin [Terracoccus sp.]